MDLNELRRLYADGKRDFGFANLKGAILASENFAGIALYQANLEEAVLVQANLSRANLRQANLKGADLSQANLSQANLRRANLTNAILEGTILEGAILTGAILPDGTLYPLSPGPEIEPQPSADAPETGPPLSKVATIHKVTAPNPENLPMFRDFQHRVPWASLIFWGLGFTSFGLLLTLHKASSFNWLIAWVSSICWIFNEALVWFIPIIAAIAVINAAGISIVTIGFVGLITSSLFFVLKFMLDWSLQETLKGSLWIGGLAAILIQLASWLFYGADAYQGGGIVVAFDTLHLAFLFILAIGLTSLGAIAWRQMLDQGFSKSQTFGCIGLTAAIGLGCGYLV
jgi:hypothetical protein